MTNDIQIPFEAYSGGKPYIFVSYAHANKGMVFPLIKQLHDKGYRIWYATHGCIGRIFGFKRG